MRRAAARARQALRSLGPWLLALAVLLGAALVAGDALARPGGGQGYSGGGGGGGGGGWGGGGGGGDDSGIVWFLFWLIMEHPVIGLPVTAVVIWFWIAQKKGQVQRRTSWDSTPTVRPRASVVPPADLERVHAVDPDFSVALFQDFAFELYARAQRARHDATELEALSPWLGQAPRDQLASRAAFEGRVTGVVIGSLTVAQVDVPAESAAHGFTSPEPERPGPPPLPRRCRVALDVEANLAAEGGDGELTWYVRERWSFEREADVRTRAPEEVLAFTCPSCGAPFVSSGGARCDHCDTVVTGGRFDWTVTVTTLQSRVARPPSLREHSPEVGTLDPTIVHPELDARLDALRAEDPAFTDEALDARLRLIFQELSTSWTQLDLRGARPFVSDSLFNYLGYWTTAYREQGLRNVVEGARITRWVPAKVVRDRWFDAITLRVWASGLDYTIDTVAGEVVGGDRTLPRPYSEYWTLVRRSDVRGAPRAEKSCPQCGAPIDRVNMAGTCESCGSLVTSGRFDWVLSRIEQDEAYEG